MGEMWKTQAPASYLVQMNAGVDRSLGLIAFEIGIHGLFTHAYGDKHLSDFLQHKDENRRLAMK